MSFGSELIVLKHSITASTKWAKIDRLPSVRPLSSMHGTQNGLKPVAMSRCSFVYWLFHTITSEQKILSKICKLKTKRTLRYIHTCLILGIETSDVGTRVVTDRQTNRQSHTQDKYRNPPAHACRGLMNGDVGSTQRRLDKIT